MIHSEDWVRADNQQFPTFGMRREVKNNSLIRRVIDQILKYLKVSLGKF